MGWGWHRNLPLIANSVWGGGLQIVGCVVEKEVTLGAGTGLGPAWDP